MAPACEAAMQQADRYPPRGFTAQCNTGGSIVFTTLTDNSKAAIFTIIVLLLAVTVAASINLFSITSEFLSIVLYMFTPALTALVMMLVVTRDGFSREGWKPLGDRKSVV